MKIICGTDFYHQAREAADTVKAFTVQEKCKEVLGKTKLGFRGSAAGAGQIHN